MPKTLRTKRTAALHALAATDSGFDPYRPHSFTAERASLAAQADRDGGGTIRYVAELIGADTDSERAVRWLVALIVLCCDPLAIVLTASAASMHR